MKDTLLKVDTAKVGRNIDRMIDIAGRHGLLFRPHFKTHQSRAIGRLFRDWGVKGIAVSSFAMAEYFADDGWDDITVAFPFHSGDLEVIQRLTGKINLNVITDRLDLIPLLPEEAGVFIEIDPGYHRTGLPPENTAAIDKLCELIDQRQIFKGFLCHQGGTYSAKSKAEVEAMHERTRLLLTGLMDRYRGAYPEIILSYGDTPSCTMASNFDGIDEIRPGNFVFFDLMQVNIGSCAFGDIAVKLSAPVIGVYPQRREIAVRAGAIHLSKEYVDFGDLGRIYGLPVDGEGQPYGGAKLARLSQEHGIISDPKWLLGSLIESEISASVDILPVHSCLAADLMPHLHTDTGEVFDTMPTALKE